MKRALLAIVLAFLLAVIAARIAYTVSVSPGDQQVNQPWVQDRMQFVAWNGEQWTAWIQGGQFFQVPRNSARWSRHAKPGIAYVDWQGEPWQAKLDGDRFRLVRRGNWDGEVVLADAIRYRDWSGERQLRTAADLRRAETAP